MATLPAQVQIVAMRRKHHNQPAPPDTVIAENDVLLAVGPTRAALDQARKILGEAAPGRIAGDRRDLDYLRVFASRPALVGRLLGDLDLPGEKASVVIHVRRGDTDLEARSDLVLEFGDRVGLLAHRGDFPALVPQDAEVLDEAAEGRLDPPPQAHRLPDQPRRTVVLHVCPQRRRQIDTSSG